MAVFLCSCRFPPEGSLNSSDSNQASWGQRWLLGSEYHAAVANPGSCLWASILWQVTLRSSGPAPMAWYANGEESRGPLPAVVRKRIHFPSQRTSRSGFVGLASSPCSNSSRSSGFIRFSLRSSLRLYCRSFGSVMPPCDLRWYWRMNSPICAAIFCLRRLISNHWINEPSFADPTEAVCNLRYSS